MEMWNVASLATVYKYSDSESHNGIQNAPH